MKTFSLLVIELSFLILLSSAISNCKSEDCHKYISIKNNDSKSIYVQSSSVGFPDTTYFKYLPNPAQSPELHKVEANESSDRAIQSRDCLENSFNKPIMIYVFDADVLETTPWATVIEQNLYLKRYDLTLQDIENKNWKIVFP